MTLHHALQGLVVLAVLATVWAMVQIDSHRDYIHKEDDDGNL